MAMLSYVSTAGLFILLASNTAVATSIELPTAPAAPMPTPQLIIGRHLEVGPTRALKQPSEAAAIARTGDTIDIDIGTYPGDVASWRADGIVIRGVGGNSPSDRVRLLAEGKSAENKAIWVIKGRNTLVENIEFSGAAVYAGNGAGIRAEGVNIKIVNCYFHDNQEGILGSAYRTGSTIEIENSEFARDGGNGGQSHEIYINNSQKLIVRGSYFHEGREGHLIKSRAEMNVLIANRITDEAAGKASYEIEFPNGGLNIVAGNLIEKNTGAQNNTILANALEGASNTVQELYVVNNTFVNDLGRGDFIRVLAPSRATVVNNIFIGGGNVLVGEGQLRNNLLAPGAGGAPTVEQALFRAGTIDEKGTRMALDAGLVDIAGFDYRLRAGSPAIGAGIALDSVSVEGLSPLFEYEHPAKADPVPAAAASQPVDIGAYRYPR
jgi:hypothetical protein